MSRQSSSSQRPLTLTEELEKLEQSITLTLQGMILLTTLTAQFTNNLYAEIDHNFSQAHRIVTTSILPLIEQYAEHSRDVWDGAKVCCFCIEDGIETYAAAVLETILRSERQCLPIRV